MPKVTDAHFDARREQILDAGSACFSEFGFRATQMRAVAERAGLSTGALYRYFPGKEELFEAVIARARPGEARMMSELLTAEPGDSAIDRLRRLPAAMTRWALESHASIRRNFRDYGEATTVPFLEESLSEMVEWTAKHLETVVREGQEEGALDPELDPVAVGSTLCYVWLGVGFGRLFDPRFDAVQLERVLDAMVEGLTAKPTGELA